MISLFGRNRNPENPEDRTDDPSTGILSPERIDKIKEKYVVITFVGGYADGIRRINLTAEIGWRCVNIFTWDDLLHALMEKV